jgi:hypothetical protein
LFENPDGKRPVWKLSQIANNIKIDLTETGLEGADWIQLVKNKG